MTSFAPDPEDPTSRPIRAGTFLHKKQNNINTEESFTLISSSGIHHFTLTKPRSSGFQPGLLPSKKSGHDFSQHPFTSNSSSSSQNSGLSDLHPSGNSIPQVPFAEEETQLLQNPERGRKASYNVPNYIPLEPLQLSSFSNIPQAGVFTNGNGKFYFHLLLAAVVSIMFYLPVLVSAAVSELSLNRLSGLSNTSLWFYWVHSIEPCSDSLESAGYCKGFECNSPFGQLMRNGDAFHLTISSFHLTISTAFHLTISSYNNNFI